MVQNMAVSVLRTETAPPGGVHGAAVMARTGPIESERPDAVIFRKCQLRGVPLLDQVSKTDHVGVFRSETKAMPVSAVPAKGLCGVASVTTTATPVCDVSADVKPASTKVDGPVCDPRHSGFVEAKTGGVERI